METFLVLNGYEFTVSVDEAERAILSVAAGTSSREDLLSWIRAHLTPAPGSGAA
jgi:prophage maintenance system killer protein